MKPISKDELTLEKLKEVYGKGNRFERFQNVLNSPISIRLIEWFVTRYAAEKKVSYVSKGRPFIVFNQYTQERMDAKKKRFDPFARGARIDFTPDDAKWLPVSTTLGQLSFFAWAFDNGVMDYIEMHVADIETHHAANNRPKDAACTKRRTRLQAIKTVSRHTVEVLVRFEDAH